MSDPAVELEEVRSIGQAFQNIPDSYGNLSAGNAPQAAPRDTSLDMLEQIKTPLPEPVAVEPVVELEAPADSEDEVDYYSKDGGRLPRAMLRCRGSMQTCCALRRQTVKYSVVAALFALYTAYFAYAMYYRLGDEGSVRLLWVTCLVVAILLLKLARRGLTSRLAGPVSRLRRGLAPHVDRISWGVAIAVLLFVLVFALVDVFVVTRTPYNLVSIAGLVFYVGISYLVSYDPTKVRWRTVAWGVCLQFLLAIVILRWDWGLMAFDWLGARVTEFLAHANAGSEFVFGPAFVNHPFAMIAMPAVAYSAMVCAVMFHVGLLQWLILSISSVMEFSMGTTGGESLIAAANIFAGVNEAPLLIRPLLPHLTRSELHAIMTAGLATVAGSVMAAYISFGVSATHLLSASVMSAPAALAIAKIVYPEMRTSSTTSRTVNKYLKTRTEANLVAAAASGALMSVTMIAYILVVLIAFVGALDFINDTLLWLGLRVGLDNLSFQLICSYLLYPLPMLMGVEMGHDCRKVAEIMGTKTFFNEFLAFIEIGNLAKNRVALESHLALNGTWQWTGDDVALQGGPLLNSTVQVLHGGFLTLRSEVIATYACCGFSNFASVGVTMGTYTALIPSRRSAIIAVSLRALFASSVACFMTACIAGIFFSGERVIPV